MIVVETIDALRAARRDLKGRVGLVPTMGYLHDGHRSLVIAARQECAHVIASIFVNPTQFGANEDLSTYPRDLPRDLAMLQAEGVDVVFVPTAAQMYPPRFQTYVNVEQVSQGKEGASRPTHFRGVTTVVSKLFNLCQPDDAYFGQKDAQQVVVIRQMVRDLNFPLQIHVCPTWREADGLAMSSRNAYLSVEDRQAAVTLWRALQAMRTRYEQGERRAAMLQEAARAVFATEPRAALDYVSVARARDLEEVETADEPLLVSLAARVGKPRLIDNMLLPYHLNSREGATAVLGVG